MQNSTKTLFIITPSLHRGGTETHLAQILPGLKQKGWSITIFLTSASGELAAPLVAAGIYIIHPDFISCKLHNQSKLLRAPLLFLTFLRLSFYFLRHKPDVTMFMLPEAYLIGGLSCLLTGQRNLIMNRRSLNSYQNKYGLLSKLEHWLHGKMRCIVTNSQANIAQLTEQENVNPKNVRLIYNGLNLSLFNNLDLLDKTAIRNKFKLPASTYVMLVIANLIQYKGHTTLLEALAAVQSQLPSDWQLLCVGQKHEPYAQHLAFVAEQLKIDDHIHWLGSQPDVTPFLALANLTISCSYEEGFSNSVLECMAAGLPLVVTNVGGNPEAVVNAVTGLVVPAHDAAALGAAILQFALHPTLSKEMGAAGKTRAQAEFGIDKCIEKYDQLFKQLCSQQ